MARYERRRKNASIFHCYAVDPAHLKKAGCEPAPQPPRLVKTDPSGAPRLGSFLYLSTFILSNSHRLIRRFRSWLIYRTQPLVQTNEHLHAEIASSS